MPTAGSDRFELRFRQVVSPQVEPRWHAWRAKQVTAFYRHVHEELTSRSPGSRLYLAGARMFEGEAIQQQLRPTLPRRLTLDQTMMQVGIDPHSLSSADGPVFLYGETVLPWTSLASQSIPLELESMRKEEDLASDFGAKGALFYHRPQETGLASFDRLSPFQPSQIRLTTQAVPSASQNRRRLVQALVHFDPIVAVDGSLRMPLGQEDSLRNLIALYRQLPAARFKATGPDITDEPLAVRYLQRADATYLLVANEAGFPVSGKIRLQMPSGCRLEELTGMRQVLPLRSDKDGCYWDVELDAYDAVGAWLPSPQVQITQASAKWSAEIDQTLKTRVSELVSRRFSLSRPREWDRLKNPGFEADERETGQIHGWMFRRGSEELVQVDKSRAHSGSSSLRLTSENEPTSIRSFSFPPPETGRLAVGMWARGDKPEGKLPLQIWAFGAYKGGTFARNDVVEVAGNDWGWVGVSFADIPVEGLVDLKLHIQLNSPGKVWIDDVRLEDLAFGRQESAALLKTVVPARETLAGGQVIQCIRILESYWPRFLLEHCSAHGSRSDPQANGTRSATETREGRRVERFSRSHPWTGSTTIAILTSGVSFRLYRFFGSCNSGRSCPILWKELSRIRRSHSGRSGRELAGSPHPIGYV